MTDRAGSGFGMATFSPGNLHGGHIPGTTSGMGATGGGAPPTVFWDKPTAGSPIYRNTEIYARVMDLDGDVARLVISANFKELEVEEVVYRRGSFSRNYRGSSVNVISGGLSFIFIRSGGWLGSPTIQVDATDATGNVEEQG